MTSMQCLLLTTTSQLSPSKNHRYNRRRSLPRIPNNRLQYSTRPSMVSSKKTLQATRVEIPKSHPICPTYAGNLLRMRNFRRRLRARVAKKGEGQSRISSIRVSVNFSCGSSISLRETLDDEEKSSLSRYRYSPYQNITIESFLRDVLAASNDPAFYTPPECRSSALSISSTTVRQCINLAALMFSCIEGRSCRLRSCLRLLINFIEMPSNSYLKCTLRLSFGFVSSSSSLSDVLSGLNAFLVVRNLAVWGGAEEICVQICWKALRMSKRREGVLVISEMKPKTRLQMLG